MIVTCLKVNVIKMGLEIVLEEKQHFLDRLLVLEHGLTKMGLSFNMEYSVEEQLRLVRRGIYHYRKDAGKTGFDYGKAYEGL